MLAARSREAYETILEDITKGSRHKRTRGYKARVYGMYWAAWRWDGGRRRKKVAA